MIGFGIALLVVCALSLFDRRAMPFALILSAGWVLGFLPSSWWPLISIASGLAMLTVLNFSVRSPWALIIVACVPVMLLCDAAYFWALAYGVYFGPEYANSLNALFIVQLLACGWPGARNVCRSLVLWLYRLDRRAMGWLASRSVGGEGAKGQG